MTGVESHGGGIESGYIKKSFNRAVSISAHPFQLAGSYVVDMLIVSWLVQESCNGIGVDLHIGSSPLTDIKTGAVCTGTIGSLP